MPAASPFEHPDLAPLGAAMRSEWRAEEEAATRDAAEQWRRSRSLADWLVERMHAGDIVAVSVGPQRFTGTIEEVGPDLVALRCTFGRVDVHTADATPLAVQVVEHATAGGRRASSRRRFRDVVVAREAAGLVRVGSATMPDGIEGAVRASRDFVTVVRHGGGEVAVPFASVWWTALPSG
jgi:hypothetical protein